MSQTEILEQVAAIAQDATENGASKAELLESMTEIADLTADYAAEEEDDEEDEDEDEEDEDEEGEEEEDDEDIDYDDDEDEDDE